LGVVQIEQDAALCEHKFLDLTCRAITAQFMADDVIALFEFEISEREVRKVAYKTSLAGLNTVATPLNVSENRYRLPIACLALCT
jgi:hypothetical protein